MSHGVPLSLVFGIDTVVDCPLRLSSRDSCHNSRAESILNPWRSDARPRATECESGLDQTHGLSESNFGPMRGRTAPSVSSADIGNGHRQGRAHRGEYWKIPQKQKGLAAEMSSDHPLASMRPIVNLPSKIPRHPKRETSTAQRR
jgi:hypothetical protein